MLTIRTATPADGALLADMSRQTFFETFAAQNSKENMDKFMEEQFGREKLIAEVTEPGSIFFLAFDGEEAVGYARMKENENPPELGNVSAIEIARIYAVSNAIGKGVGKELLHRCIELATARKKKMIWLGVWENNHRAIDFYKKWGFTKFGTQIFPLGNDLQTDWLMKKELEQVR